MPSPEILIWAAIAVLAVLLWPIRNLMRRRYRAGEDDEHPER